MRCAACAFSTRQAVSLRAHASAAASSIARVRRPRTNLLVRRVGIAAVDVVVVVVVDVVVDDDDAI